MKGSMQLVEGREGLPCKRINPKDVRRIGGKTTTRILMLLGEHEEGLHASAIARTLQLHEQKVYYHTRKLLEAGVIEVDHYEEKGGGTAKILRLVAPAIGIAYAPFQPVVHTLAVPEHHQQFLAPFIRNGKLNAHIIISSPDPHGPESARGRDGGYAFDFGMFLGSYLQKSATGMRFDTELTSWSENLIIIGGPIVNKAAAKINDYLPVPYRQKQFVSSATQTSYARETHGIIAKIPNPFTKGKWIMIIAGKRYMGTRAAILCFARKFEEICERVQEDSTCSVVVEGLDADSDGIIDDVRILE